MIAAMIHRPMARAAHIGFMFFLDTLEGALGRLDKKRGLVSSDRGWDADHVDQ
jgi:hypothetical protein